MSLSKMFEGSETSDEYKRALGEARKAGLQWLGWIVAEGNEAQREAAVALLKQHEDIADRAREITGQVIDGMEEERS